MAKRWRILPHDSGTIAALQQAASLPAVVAQLLVGRGICDPTVGPAVLGSQALCLARPGALARLRGSQPAAGPKRFATVGASSSTVTMTVDGITGTALLRQCIKLLGGEVSYYVPHRLDEGYGLNHEAIRTLAAEKAELIVTVDCGITSVAQAATARELWRGG